MARYVLIWSELVRFTKESPSIILSIDERIFTLLKWFIYTQRQKRFHFIQILCIKESHKYSNKCNWFNTYPFSFPLILFNYLPAAISPPMIGWMKNVRFHEPFLILSKRLKSKDSPSYWNLGDHRMWICTFTQFDIRHILSFVTRFYKVSFSFLFKLCVQSHEKKKH